MRLDLQLSQKKFVPFYSSLLYTPNVLLSYFFIKLIFKTLFLFSLNVEGFGDPSVFLRDGNQVTTGFKN